MECYSCGKDVPEGSRFCLECAAPVHDPAAVTIGTAGAPMPVAYTPAFDEAPPPEDPLLVQLRESLSGEYVVEKEVGRGGMAVVFRAREVNLNRVVALKVLPPEIAMVGGTADRFKREARMSAGLDHANIIPVYRVGQAGPLHYMAVKFMEGRALDSIVEAQGALPLPVVILVLKAAAQALAYAHDKGVVHRDIKGANILVDKDGRVVVADFGIARAQEEASLTASGMIVGTPYFMSPEQCSGSKVGGQSDQYSLGILAFQLLTGEVPFQADSLMGILQHHFMTPPPDIRQVRAGVPEALVQVVERSLRKKPEERYASTRDMVSALKAVPFSDDEERDAETMLRALASGETGVEKVRTHSLPPLAQSVLGSPAASATQALGGASPNVTTPTPAGLAAVTPGTAEVPLDASGKPRRPRPVAKKSKVPLIGSIVAGAGLAAFGLMWFTKKADTPTVPTPTIEAPAPAPVSAAAATGVLRFASLPPGATITVDDVPAGPEVPNLAPGLHRFTVQAPGYEGWTYSAQIRAGDTTTMTASLAPIRTTPASERQVVTTPAPRPQAPAAAPAGPPGKVRIGALPLEADAIIQIDGRQIGRGRVIDQSVASGRRRLRISAPGYTTVEETIEVRENETFAKNYTLKPQS